MRKTWAAILAVMLLVCGCAAGEAPKAPDFILEGYDGDSTGCIWESNLFFARMQEKTGISFQFRQSADYTRWTERKKEIAEGTDLPDVLFKAELTPQETVRMYEAGILIDLRPYLETYAPDLWALLQAHPDWLAAVTLPDGAIVALPAFNNMQNNDLMWINTRWLVRLGLEKPTTAEEMTEVLRAFRTRDPNGNGSADEIPLTFVGMWELRFLGHAFGIIDNDYYVTNHDGTVSSSLPTEENRAFLTWLHGLWEEGLLDPNGFTMADNLRQITDDSKPIPYGMMMSATPLTVVPSGALGQFGILEPLMYEGRQVYRDLTGDVIRGTFAITSACREPEKLVGWVNYLYTQEGALMAEYGLEGVEYSWNDQGYWEWNDDLTTVARMILPQNTIGSGTAYPGVAEEDFQLRYGEEETRRNIEMVASVRPYSVFPYPYVFMSAEDAAEIAAIHKDLMDYAEGTMACFVTGDLELNDENWEKFCSTLREKGLDRAVAIWQKYVTKRSGE